MKHGAVELKNQTVSGIVNVSVVKVIAKVVLSVYSDQIRKSENKKRNPMVPY